MYSINTYVVKKLLRERPQDLLDLMEGESEYCRTEPTNLPRNSDESYIRRMAFEHIWFVSEFGFDVDKAEKDGKYYSSYPDYFEQWLELGCQTLASDALDAYLKENPLGE